MTRKNIVYTFPGLIYLAIRRFSAPKQRFENTHQKRKGHSMSKKGLMLFRANSNPDRPHPEIVTDEKLISYDAEGFFKAYHCHDTLDGAEMEADSEHCFNALGTNDEEAMAAYRRGRGLPYSVEVFDDGSVDVFNRDTGKFACRYTMVEINDFFDFYPYEDKEPFRQSMPGYKIPEPT